MEVAVVDFPVVIALLAAGNSQEPSRHLPGSCWLFLATPLSPPLFHGGLCGSATMIAIEYFNRAGAGGCTPLAEGSGTIGTIDLQRQNIVNRVQFEKSTRPNRSHDQTA